MGYRIHTHSGGSLHDHTYGFKVDLDVVSKTNSFRVVEVKMGRTLDAVNAGRCPPSPGCPATVGAINSQPGYLAFPKMRYVEETQQTSEG
eukprot:gene316-6120_t